MHLQDCLPQSSQFIAYHGGGASLMKQIVVWQCGCGAPNKGMRRAPCYCEKKDVAHPKLKPSAADEASEFTIVATLLLVFFFFLSLWAPTLTHASPPASSAPAGSRSPGWSGIVSLKTWISFFWGICRMNFKGFSSDIFLFFPMRPYRAPQESPWSLKHLVRPPVHLDRQRVCLWTKLIFISTWNIIIIYIYMYIYISLVYIYIYMYYCEGHSNRRQQCRRQGGFRKEKIQQ